jgi:hypothetical protein
MAQSELRAVRSIASAFPRDGRLSAWGTLRNRLTALLPAVLRDEGA